MLLYVTTRSYMILTGVFFPAIQNVQTCDLFKLCSLLDLKN